jgi:hypothetical protein
MICQFGQLNVENPSHDIQEMQQRASLVGGLVAAIGPLPRMFEP